MASGGASAEVSVPIAGTAGLVSSTALAGQVGVQLLRDGEVSAKTMKDVGVSVAFSKLSKIVGKHLDSVLSKFSQPNPASDEVAKATTQGIVKVYEESANAVADHVQNKRQ